MTTCGKTCQLCVTPSGNTMADFSNIAFHISVKILNWLQHIKEKEAKNRAQKKGRHTCRGKQGQHQYSQNPPLHLVSIHHHWKCSV